MPAPHRQNRAPISCEPCRVRKIRCSRPRGPPPCETCVRRSLAPSCAYAGRNTASTPTGPVLPPSPLSERSTTAASSSADGLAERVAKLESMLQAQNASSDRNFIGKQGPAKFTGVLSISESGHERFLPSALGSRANSSFLDPQQVISGFNNQHAGPYPLGQKEVDLNALHASLPPRSQCSQLKDIYFASFAPYAGFERDAASMPLSWMALLFAILGTAVTALDPTSHLLNDLSRKPIAADKIAELSQRYRKAAMSCLESDNFLWQHNTTTLQALIVLIYGINHSHGQTWALLGTTHHIALSLGCHVDPSNFDLDVVSCEERRRCWAGLQMLYMVQNTSLGHLDREPRLFSASVQLPADIDDVDIQKGDRNLPIPPERPSQMSYLLLKFRLYDISSDICTLVLSTQDPPPSVIDQMDKAIRDEQRAWMEKYHSHTHYGSLPIHHEAHLNILHGYAHQMTLLLHHKAMRETTSDTLQFRHSMQKCLTSARELLQIHDTFFRRQDLSPFGWYLRGICSFHAFHASASLIAYITSESWFEGREDVLSIVRRNLRRFETLSEASPVCERASPIIRQLLSAVETWSIDLMCERNPTHEETVVHGSAEASHTVHASTMQVRSELTPLEHAPSPSTMFDGLFDQLDPQLWLTSSSISWNQWDSLSAGVPIPECVG